MNEAQLKVFVDGVKRYFKQLKLDDIVIGTPYLLSNQQPFSSDYTGIIGITGNRKGIVYFSSPIGLINQALMLMGETDHSDQNQVDLVGEVANTIAGNARTEFGENFEISVPVVVKGLPTSIHLPESEHSFIIPIEWLKYRAALVVCIVK